jgi:two-component system phosphate regulon response regulator PhoB
MERIKALKRRTEELPDANGDVVARLGISVDRRRFKAMAGNDQLELTKSEFRLLDTLIRQPGRAFDRAELIDAALGGDTLVLVRTIDVHIRALRRKLGAHADTIETVRGVGYRFREA